MFNILTTPYHYCSFINSNDFYFNPPAYKKYRSGVIIKQLANKVLMACQGSWSGKLIMFSLHPTIIALL